MEGKDSNTILLTMVVVSKNPLINGTRPNSIWDGGGGGGKYSDVGIPFGIISCLLFLSCCDDFWDFFPRCFMLRDKSGTDGSGGIKFFAGFRLFFRLLRCFFEFLFLLFALLFPRFFPLLPWFLVFFFDPFLSWTDFWFRWNWFSPGWFSNGVVISPANWNKSFKKYSSSIQIYTKQGQRY